MREVARGEVDRVAAALVAGEPLTGPDEVTFGWSAVLVLVTDEAGEVVGTMPSVGFRLHEVPGGVDVEGLGTTLRDDIEHLADEAHDRRADHLFDTRLTRPGGDLVVASRSVESPEGTRTVVAISPLAEVTRSVDAVIRALLFGAPLLLLFVAATTWVAVDRSLRPVEHIRRQADAISHSTLSDRLPEPVFAGELGGLTATLNEMLGRLEAGARRQREFITDASHELRTPLAAMRAELEVALAHADTAQWQPVARRLLADQRRLEQLAGELADAARAYRELLVVAPDAEAYRALASVNEMRGDREAAVRARTAAAEAFTAASRPDEAAVEWMAIANQRRLAARHEEAIELAEQARRDAASSRLCPPGRVLPPS